MSGQYRSTRMTARSVSGSLPMRIPVMVAPSAKPTEYFVGTIDHVVIGENVAGCMHDDSGTERALHLQAGFTGKTVAPFAEARLLTDSRPLQLRGINIHHGGCRGGNCRGIADFRGWRWWLGAQADDRQANEPADQRREEYLSDQFLHGRARLAENPGSVCWLRQQRCRYRVERLKSPG